MFKTFFNKKENSRNYELETPTHNSKYKFKNDIMISSIRPKLEPRKSFNATANQAVFEGSVLLRNTDFDFNEFETDLASLWFVKLVETSNENGVRVFDVGTMEVTYSLVEAQVPNREAEFAAAKNYMWAESLNQTREHRAHIVISVKGRGTPKEKGLLFTKIMDICCEQEVVLGIFANGTVYSPESYKGYASVMAVEHIGPLPILNLVWMGFSRSETGFNMYTKGLHLFDKEEMEIIDSQLPPNALLNAMLDIVSYVLENNITLTDGETLILAEHKKWKFRRSKALAFDGVSMKIEWKK